MDSFDPASLDAIDDARAVAVLRDAWGGYRAMLRGQGHRAMSTMARVVGEAAFHPAASAAALALRGLVARACCDWETAGRDLMASFDYYAGQGDRARAGLVSFLEIEGLVAQGRLEEAQATASRVVRDTELDGDALTLSLMVLRSAQGRLDEALELGEALDEEGDPDTRRWAIAIRAEIFVDKGELASADRVLSASLIELEQQGVRAEIYARSLWSLAQARLATAWADPRARTGAWLQVLGQTIDKGASFARPFARYAPTFALMRASLARLRAAGPDEGSPAIAVPFDRSLVLERCLLASRRCSDDEIADLAQQHRLMGAPARADRLGRAASKPRLSTMFQRSVFAPGGAVAAGDVDVELAAIFAVNRAISSTLDVDELMATILREVVQLLRAERAAILQRDQEGQVICVAAWELEPHRLRGEDGISFTVVEEVLDSGALVLTDNAQADERLRGQASVLATDIRSILCAPLSTNKQRLGCIYLDSTLRTHVFKQQHVELLEVLASQAATALENARAYDQIDTLNRDLEQRVRERTAQLQATNEELSEALHRVEHTQLRLVQAQKDALEAEMTVARNIQRGLVPPVTEHEHGGVRIAGSVRPASMVGGDVWTFRAIDDARVLVFVADATGHGVGPGMVTTVAKGGLDSLVSRFDELGLDGVLRTVSGAIHRSAHGDTTLSAFACVVDIERRSVRCVNASHPGPLLVLPGDGLAQVSVVTGPLGPLLGLSEQVEYEPWSFEYEPGSRLLLYTDGIVECSNERGRPFGARRLRKAAVLGLTQTVEGHRDRVLDEAWEYYGERAPDDDITVVVVEFPPAKEGAAAG